MPGGREQVDGPVGAAPSAATPAADTPGPAARAPGAPSGPATVPTPQVAHPGTTDELDEMLLGGPRALSARDLAQRTGIPLDTVRDFWRTLGLPSHGDDEVMFTERDAEALARAQALVLRHGLAPSTVVTVVRALGHTSDRLALWQVEALVEDMAIRYDLDDTSARLLVLDRLRDLAPLLEQQLLHSYRRQLAAVADRYAAEFGHLRDVTVDGSRLPLARAVGFADMVSFTRRTAGLGSGDLSSFVQRFETAARDVVVNAGGRVVKTIGDAVLFIADTPGAGAAVAVGLAEAFGVAPGEPVPTTGELARAGGAVDASRVTPVRVGLVWGRVLSRFGDVFGPSVNLAARLTDVADPSTVVVDPATAQVLGGDPRFRLTRQPPHELAGVGEVTPFRLESATD